MQSEDLRLKNTAQICELVEEQARIIKEQSSIIEQLANIITGMAEEKGEANGADNIDNDPHTDGNHHHGTMGIL